MKSHRRFNHLFRLFISGLILVGAGWHLSVLHAQTVDPEPSPTPYRSVFDSMTTVPSSTPEAPSESTEETAPAPTRIPSIFDTDQAEQPTQAAAPTRVPSIFDTEQPAQTTLPQQPTRVPSIFDEPSETDVTEEPQTTRVPSIFDSPTEDAPAEQSTAEPQATPYSSVLDSIQDSVIRFEGDEPPDQAYCLDCHANPALQMVLPSGDTLSVTVDESEYAASVHGKHGTEGYRCIRCHVGMNEYPHEEITASSVRELFIDYSTGCARCHPANYDETMDGVHLELLASGNQEAAVCADCHTGHAVHPLTDEITGDPLPGSNEISVQMCMSCHADVYDHYANSVHGQAVLAGSQDAATCVDCHGVHETEGPSSTAAFRLFSPQTCAECHANEQLMSRYNISTDVFDTYVSDFHGTNVMLFQQTTPDQEFNAPVCVDCHGVHEILAADEENSPVFKENLLVTCQRCHPDASSDFPDAWLSHHPVSFEETPVVAVADLIYDILIPTIIGGMGLFVATDIYRRISRRRKER